MAGAGGGVASSITDGILTSIATWFTPRQREVNIQGGTRHDIRGRGEPRTVNVSFHARAGSPRVSVSAVAQRQRDDGSWEDVA